VKVSERREVTMTELEGRTVLVTGANSGIGRQTALELARKGARVHVACRSEERARPVLDDIMAIGGPDAASFLPLDLADLASVRACAEAYRKSGEPLHVLVNNAGVAGQRGETTDGFELAFGVNHLGHFLLTVSLLDELRHSAPSRVVTVSSDAHYQARGVDFESLRGSTRSFTAMGEYNASKLCNVLFTQELARRLAAQGVHGVTTYALHPGVIASNIWRRIPWPIEPLAKLFMGSIESGARTSVFCASDPDLSTSSGQYYADRKARPASPRATPELGAALWERSEAWTSS
jgi:NAD(P)-dependent dehydrogenase (short-subunit alcohol dehydrogenase family)